MGVLVSKSKKLNKSIIKVKYGDKNLSPGKYYVFDTYYECIRWIIENFDLEDIFYYKKEIDYQIEGINDIKNKFDFPKQIILIDTFRDGYKKYYTFEFTPSEI